MGHPCIKTANRESKSENVFTKLFAVPTCEESKLNSSVKNQCKGTPSTSAFLMSDSNESPFSCPQCDKKFKTSGSLNKHAIIHTGLTPYVCLECNKNFTPLSHLTAHNMVNTNEKPFCCTKCDKKCNDLGTLKNHERVHSGERSFYCLNC